MGEEQHETGRRARKAWHMNSVKLCGESNDGKTLSRPTLRAEATQRETLRILQAAYDKCKLLKRVQTACCFLPAC